MRISAIFRLLIVNAVILAALSIMPVSAPVTIGSFAVTTPVFFICWDSTNVEAITTLRWPVPSPTTCGGQPNLTNTFALGSCNNGDVEYWGNAWAPPDPQIGGTVLVGAGTTGSWTAGPDDQVIITSNSVGCPPSSAGVSVETRYKFFGSGPAVNKIRMQRTFMFTTFDLSFRPYIVRLPGSFTQVLHPDSSGTSLIDEQATGVGAVPGNCPFGGLPGGSASCQTTNWDGTFFMVRNPSTGLGMVVKEGTPCVVPSSCLLWIDWDAGSFTTSTSVLLISPTGGFVGSVTEVEFLCFFDGSYTPSLALPAGCGSSGGGGGAKLV